MCASIRLRCKRIAGPRGSGAFRDGAADLPVLLVLQFPLSMKIMTDSAFLFGAVGSVHIANTIERKREIGVDEPLTITTHAENLREHCKGLLIDMISEFTVGSEVVAVQTATSSSSSAPACPANRAVPSRRTRPSPPDAVLSVDLGRIRGARGRLR